MAPVNVSLVQCLNLLSKILGDMYIAARVTAVKFSKSARKWTKASPKLFKLIKLGIFEDVNL